MLVVLLVLSLAGVGLAFLVPGYDGLLLVAGPSALACLWLLWRGRGQGSERDVWPEPDRGRVPGRAKGAPRAERYVIIDGSNVMHWREEDDGAPPRLETVAEVIRQARDRGFTPGVVFDANAGYRIGDRYLGDRELAGRLGLDPDRVRVVDKGTIADAFILMAARSLKARIVTADRYRDHAGDYPEVTQPGTLIRGGMREGKVWVAWGEE